MIGLRSYIHPQATMLTAAVLAVFYALLSLQVVRLRWRERVGLGLPTNPTSPLFRMARVHANFAEYIPLLLLMMFFLESTGANPTAVRLCGGLMIVGRVAHARGLITVRTPNPWRVVGTAMTFGLLFTFAGWIFLRELM
jgi:uncharacterized membrane protein YecN with MAPEG domain